jgi:crotonobetainyl-CoA:carnitine CoA-transferase CaiB-like acyl-CoA transferase
VSGAEPAPRPGALAGVRVVELGEGVAAPLCGKLFADLGAEVVKVEPPQGDASRRVGPFASTDRDPETSALFLHCNTGKRGVVADLDTAKGRELVASLLRGADVLLDDHPPGWLEARGIVWEEVHERHPRLVLARITSYGLTGPRRDQPADELTLQHASGLANLLPQRAESIDRAPVRMGGFQASGHGALAAAVATLAALLGRDDQGGGRLVDVSLQETLVAMISPYVTSQRYQGTTWNRVPDRPPAMGRLPTRDGWVVLNATDDHHFGKLRELMGNPEWSAGDQWLSLAYRARHLMEIAPRIEAWVREQGKHELHEAAGRRGIPIGPVLDAAEVLASAQYAARDYFVELEHERAGRLRYAGWPFGMGATPAGPHRAAPRLGEHQREVEEEMARPHPRPLSQGERGVGAAVGGSVLPLSGLRVLELCWVWAGPYAGLLLASLGAEVIRVEGHQRSDLMRRTVVWPLPEPKPIPVPSAQGMAFNSVNMSKRSVTLDLADPRGVELARRLAARSDVVVDNMRPGALDKIGLGYEDLRRIRPDLVVASSSGRGRGGPHSDFLGYAMVHHAIGGGAWLTGYADEPPSHSLGDVDLMNATALAAAILAALHHRSRTGEGQLIDYSQCEGVTMLVGDTILAAQRTGQPPGRLGNAHAEHAPHGVYRAWGVDRWVAISVTSDESFAHLAAAMGRPELARDPRFATSAARKQHEVELDAIVEAWTRARDRDAVVAELVAAGVVVAPSRDGRDLYADRHLRERGAFATVDHPELGPLELVGAPFRFGAEPLSMTVAPRLGEHSDVVLGELLGLGEEEIEELRRDGVVGPRPGAARGL